METNHKEHYEAPQMEVFIMAQAGVLCASPQHQQAAGDPVLNTDSFFGDTEEKW